uniref:breast carcinoma-amplified sequence 1 isoform X5 n=1 Tax=Doryrhamphus excisus TaxID=161450 RepID=UPI0025AE2A6E|nr:breast carcinoma-amplified sequence 1 isoform X5 [Doryrhamphus excisus]
MGNEHAKAKVEVEDENTQPAQENGGVGGLTVDITSNGLDIDVNSETSVQPTGKAAAANPLQEPDSATEPSPASPEVEQWKVDKVNLLDKLFPKKAEPEATVDPKNVDEDERRNDGKDGSRSDARIEPEPANSQPETLTQPPTPQTPQTPPTPQTPQTPPVAWQQTDEADGPAARTEETNPQDAPVMNFFRNLMTPAKTSKKETADVPKDQRQKENQPAPSTTVAQVSEAPAAAKGMLIPPPPPPEPPKVEVKVELSSKSAKEKPKTATAKDGKSSKDVLGKFFRPKTNKEAPLTSDPDPQVETPVQIQTNKETPVPAPQVETPVEITKKADPSKAATLEATAKPEAEAAVPQEKKTPAKSTFFSFFKPKAGDPKKASPAPATAAPPTAKAKEEPKAPAKSPEAVPDNKAAAAATAAASKAGDGGANAARKTEKRNSIQLFLKHLGQKRHSTDAGVQTEPVIMAAAAEKSK